MLDDLAAFQQTLFSSAGVERLSEAILSGSTFLDPDPELNELEQQGKTVFTRACAQCHGGALHPSTSTPDAALVRPPVRYHSIRPPARPATDGFCRPLRLADARPTKSRSRTGPPNRHYLDPGRCSCRSAGILA
jgi:cytochrome c peroxidase